MLFINSSNSPNDINIFEDKNLNISSITKKHSYFDQDNSKENIACINNNLSYQKIKSNKTISEVFNKYSYNKKYNKFLKIHEIKERHRGKIINWMYSVMKKLYFKEKTIYKSFLIMDEYFRKNTKNVIKLEDLHIIGVVAMLIASKKSNIILKLDLIYNKIVKKKIEIEKILLKEIEFIEILSNRINKYTHYDLVLKIVKKFQIKNIISEKNYNFLLSVIFNFLNICTIDLRIYEKLYFNEIVISCFILSLKVLETTDKTIKTKKFYLIFIKELNLDEKLISEKIKLIHTISLEFKTKFNHLNEILKSFEFKIKD